MCKDAYAQCGPPQMGGGGALTGVSKKPPYGEVWHVCPLVARCSLEGIGPIMGLPTKEGSGSTSEDGCPLHKYDTLGENSHRKHTP